MRAVVYTETGDTLGPRARRARARRARPWRGARTDRPRRREPDRLEVPRRWHGQRASPEIVPNQDGAGVVDAVGAGVDDPAVG